jgi:hypothetical protein
MEREQVTYETSQGEKSMYYAAYKLISIFLINRALGKRYDQKPTVSPRCPGCLVSGVRNLLVFSEAQTDSSQRLPCSP